MFSTDASEAKGQQGVMMLGKARLCKLCDPTVSGKWELRAHARTHRSPN